MPGWASIISSISSCSTFNLQMCLFFHQESALKLTFRRIGNFVNIAKPIIFVIITWCYRSQPNSQRMGNICKSMQKVIFVIRQIYCQFTRYDRTSRIWNGRKNRCEIILHCFWTMMINQFVVLKMTSPQFNWFWKILYGIIFQIETNRGVFFF